LFLQKFIFIRILNETKLYSLGKLYMVNFLSEFWNNFSWLQSSIKYVKTIFSPFSFLTVFFCSSQKWCLNKTFFLPFFFHKYPEVLQENYFAFALFLYVLYKKFQLGKIWEKRTFLKGWKEFEKKERKLKKMQFWWIRVNVNTLI
jgi:hypothetical protein